MSTEAVQPRHASEADAKADRELCGRFAAGNPGGPGNPYARQTAMFKKAIHAATTPDEAKALARKIYEMAMEGDLAAARLYFSYTAGKPQAAIDPDRVDIHELQIYRETAPLYPTRFKLKLLRSAGSSPSTDEGNQRGRAEACTTQKFQFEPRGE